MTKQQFKKEYSEVRKNIDDWYYCDERFPIALECFMARQRIKPTLWVRLFRFKDFLEGKRMFPDIFNEFYGHKSYLLP